MCIQFPQAIAQLKHILDIIIKTLFSNILYYGGELNAIYRCMKLYSLLLIMRQTIH